MSITTRFHLTLKERAHLVAGTVVCSGTTLSDGTYRALIDVETADEDISFVEECLDEDDNVIFYHFEILNPTAGKD